MLASVITISLSGSLTRTYAQAHATVKQSSSPIEILMYLIFEVAVTVLFLF